MITVSRWQVGALASLVALIGAGTAHAQLRSLRAVKYLSLESSTGAERLTKALVTEFQDFVVVVVTGIGDVPADGHANFARCLVRANLPKPRTVALECYDAAGAYVGTRRATKIQELAWEVWRASYSGSSGARPLHRYRYIYVDATTGDPSFGNRDYLSVVNLLRQSPFTVITETEASALPHPERQFILRCSISPNYGYTVGVVGHMYSELLLFDTNGEKVASVKGGGRLIAFVTSTETGRRKSLEDAVRNLIRERQEDEAVYAPRKQE